jgi:hypothetical protein
MGIAYSQDSHARRSRSSSGGGRQRGLTTTPSSQEARNRDFGLRVVLEASSRPVNHRQSPILGAPHDFNITFISSRIELAICNRSRVRLAIESKSPNGNEHWLLGLMGSIPYLLFLTSPSRDVTRSGARKLHEPRQTHASDT